MNELLFFFFNQVHYILLIFENHRAKSIAAEYVCRKYRKSLTWWVNLVNNSRVAVTCSTLSQMND